jgi:hypothetical protein
MKNENYFIKLDQDYEEIYAIFFRYGNELFKCIDNEEDWWDLFLSWDDLVPAMHLDLKRKYEGRPPKPERVEFLRERIVKVRRFFKKLREKRDLPLVITALHFLTIQHLELLLSKLEAGD